MRAIAIGLVAAALGPPAEAWGLALRSSASEAVAEASPGRKARSTAIRIENAGGEPVELKTSVARPAVEELRDGYEPLPEPGWVDPSLTRRRLAAGESGEAWAEVAVPKSAPPGRYQARWLTEGRVAGGSRVVLRSRLLVHVGTQAPRWTPHEGGGGRFALLPREARAEGVAPGGLVEVRIKAAPLEDIGGLLKARVLQPAEWRDGFEPAPDPAWLVVRTAQTRLERGRVAELPLTLTVPDQPRYRGRKWVFVVAVEDETGGREDFWLMVTTRR